MIRRKRKERSWEYQRKKRLLLWVMTIVLLGCLAAAYLFRIRGSEILTSKEYIGTDDIVFYEQKDPRWIDDLLGDSMYTMGKSGCLVTCIAAALQMEGVYDSSMTPGKLNQYFSENQVYDDQGNLQWTVLDGLGDLHTEVLQTPDPGSVTEHLRRKVYPIVRVRMHGLGNFHYVLIVKAQNGIYYCMDPLSDTGEPVPLTEFGNRAYAVRYVY